jgi:hypothetical protein
MPIQAGFGNGSFRTYGLTKRGGLDRTGAIEYLIIAGGGAGGSNNGGGGGAGGILQGVGHPVNAGRYVVTVGAGGASIIDTAGSNGSNSVFDTLVAIGGGGGAGTGGGVPDDTYGRSGGSGGGGTNIFSPGSPRVGLGTPGQGNNGGQGNNPGAYIGGGGGGAGSAGGSTENANGGIGIFSTFSGSNTAYGGGGGGSGESGPGGAPPWGRGGAGYAGYGSPSSTVSPFGILEGTPFGGGDGNTPATQTVAFAGVTNTGGGGGGTAAQPNYYGGNGGSGIVVLRYPISYATAGVTTGSYAEVNGYRIFTFAATGSLTF